MRTIERNCKSKLKQKFSTPANWDNGIKTVVVIVVVVTTKIRFTKTKTNMLLLKTYLFIRCGKI